MTYPLLGADSALFFRLLALDEFLFKLVVRYTATLDITVNQCQSVNIIEIPISKGFTVFEYQFLNLYRFF